MSNFVAVVMTLVAQLFIVVMLTFLLIKQRAINRELEALRRWVMELDESRIPWRERR